jgi:glycerol-3-phosphate cytidylyltransferase
MKIGITFSAFDLLHAGHKMLEEAKRECDYLIALQTDPTLDRPENSPTQSVVERYIQLKGCYVDEIVPMRQNKI